MSQDQVNNLSTAIRLMRIHGFQLTRNDSFESLPIEKLHADSVELAKIMLGCDEKNEPTESVLKLAGTIAENTHLKKIGHEEIIKSCNNLDVEDRESQIFKSIQNTVELMGFSPIQEVREAQATLCFLVDEYAYCRQAILAI
jgi:hypothetical protein